MPKASRRKVMWCEYNVKSIAGLSCKSFIATCECFDTKQCQLSGLLTLPTTVSGIDKLRGTRRLHVSEECLS